MFVMMGEATAPQSGQESIKGAVTLVELSRRDRAIARRSAESRAVVPDVQFCAEVDMAATLARAAQLRCGTTALLVLACALALRATPRANGAYRDGRLELYSRINIGVRIAELGIYETPTIFDADRKTASELASELASLGARARDGSLTASELAGATFTVTDSGFTVTDSRPSEITALAPLIVIPQAAALAAGPIRDVPLIRDGEVVAGQAAVLTLAVDHRILYGAHGAAFLAEIKRHLEEPSM
jgi:pyruvate dehydrogenase E2 component (dihydrolipoyllysine-residue acetyltransferase)